MPALLRFLLREEEPAMNSLADLLEWRDLRSLSNLNHTTRHSVMMSYLFRRVQCIGIESGVLDNVRQVATAAVVDDVALIERARRLYARLNRIMVRGVDNTVLRYRTKYNQDTRNTLGELPVAVLQGISSLVLSGWKSSSIHRLQSVASLVSLEIRQCTPVGNFFDALASLTQLRRLALVDFDNVPSLSFVEPMLRLEYLRIGKCFGPEWAWSTPTIVALPPLTELHLRLVMLRDHGEDTQSLALPNTLRRVTLSYIGASKMDAQRIPVLLRNATNLESLIVNSHLPVSADYAFDTDCHGTLVPLLPLHQWRQLKHLDLEDLFFDDIEALASCTELLSLNVNLHDDNFQRGKATALRSLCKLQKLACRNVVVADFIDALPLLKELQMWVQPRAWAPMTRPYVNQYDPDRVRRSIEPSPDILRLRLLYCLSIRVHESSTFKYEGRGCPLQPYWFNFITTECVLLVKLEIGVYGSESAGHYLKNPVPSDLKALTRLEHLALPRFLITLTAETFLPLHKLRVLNLLHYPKNGHSDRPEAFNLAPLYTVGLPALSCLILGTYVECLPLKQYGDVSKTLPALEEILHPTANCRWQMHVSCRKSGCRFYHYF